MATNNDKKGSKFLTRLTVGAALGFAAFLLLKSEKPATKEGKQSIVKGQKEEMFI